MRPRPRHLAGPHSGYQARLPVPAAQAPRTSRRSPLNQLCVRRLSLTAPRVPRHTVFEQVLQFLSGLFLPAPWCQALGAGDTDRAGDSLAASAVKREALVREGLEEEEQLSSGQGGTVCGVRREAWLRLDRSGWWPCCQDDACGLHSEGSGEPWKAGGAGGDAPWKAGPERG